MCVMPGGANLFIVGKRLNLGLAKDALDKLPAVRWPFRARNEFN